MNGSVNHQFMSELIEKGTNLSILFAYFSITASFLLIFPILLNYHSHFIKIIDSYVEKQSSIMIVNSRDIIRGMKREAAKSVISKYNEQVNFLIKEFNEAKEVLKPKQNINFAFGLISVTLFFVILYKIYIYSYTPFPVEEFLQEVDFTKISFFSLCWWLSVVSSVYIFYIRLEPLFRSQGSDFFGFKRWGLILLFSLITMAFWTNHFFYFAYPAIAYFLSTMLLSFLLLVENLWFYYTLTGKRSTIISIFNLVKANTYRGWSKIQSYRP